MALTVGALQAWRSILAPRLTVAVALAAGVGVMSATPAAALPAEVDATYTISHPLASGSFQFSSRSKGSTYRLRGDARIDALLGIYTWRSSTVARGRVRGGKTRPAAYALNFRGGRKQGSVEMKFPLRSTKSVKANPPIKPSNSRVKVTRRHLSGVLDPLSAILAFTVPKNGRVAGVNPCRGSIPVFDGKQRFDLVLTSKGTARYDGRAITGMSRKAYVCRVQYKPRAGYKLNDETRFMMNNAGIEIWLVPARSAGLFVPHKMVIP
ncbi:MAG: DUF3108 domain-containing protein, partial [Pseudomonadota bacterium]